MHHSAISGSRLIWTWDWNKFITVALEINDRVVT